jgi:hypothetical protein
MRPYNLVYCVISPLAIKRAPLYRGLPSGIHYYGIKYTKMSLQPKRTYLAKQTLTNKYSEFQSAYHLVMNYEQMNWVQIDLAGLEI